MGEDTSDSGSFSTSKSISISSSYLWFMGESFELGPEFTYSGQWRKNPSYRYHSWSIGVGPRLKYNLADVNRSTVIPYGVAGIQISTGNSDISTPANKNTGDQSYLGMGITFPVRATAAIYLECQYNWAHSKSKYDVPAGSNDDGIEVDSSRDLWTLLGVNLYL